LSAIVKRRLIVLTIVVVFFLFALFAPYEQTVTGRCIVAPGLQWTLRHFGSGLVAAEWDVNLIGRPTENSYFLLDQPDVSFIQFHQGVIEGAEVELDSPIASLHSLRNQMEFEQMEAESLRETQRKEFMQAGERPEELQVVERRAEQSKVKLKNYQREFDRVSQLHDSSLVSDAEYEIALSRLEQLQADYQYELARVRAARVGEHPKLIDVQDAELERIRRGVESYKDLLGLGEEIRTPLGGIVAKKSDDRSLISIQDIDTVGVYVIFPEAYASVAAKGLNVRVSFASLLGKSYHVKIDQIHYFGGDTMAVYGVGLLNNPDHMLQPGMHAIARIPVGKLTLYDRVKRTLQR